MQEMISDARNRGYRLLTNTREQGCYALFARVGKSGDYLASDGRLLDPRKAEWHWGDSLDEAVTAAYAAAGFVMALSLEDRVMLLEKRILALEKERKNGQVHETSRR